MISAHFGKFVVLIIAVSSHKQSERELKKVFLKEKRIDYLNNIIINFLLISN